MENDIQIKNRKNLINSLMGKFYSDYQNPSFFPNYDISLIYQGLGMINFAICREFPNKCFKEDLEALFNGEMPFYVKKRKFRTFIYVLDMEGFLNKGEGFKIKTSLSNDYVAFDPRDYL